MFPNQQQENNFFNAVDLLALIIGFQNLYENRQQSAYNDVHSANDEQAEYLLNEIKKLFEEQNALLKELLDRLKKGNNAI